MFSIGSISAVSRVRSLILPEVGGCVRAHFPEKRLVIEPMFSTAVTRHKQQTSGRLRTANNTIVKCFFKFMPLVSVSFHQSCPSFDGIRSIDNTSRQVLLSKEYFLWSSLQRFDKSFVSRHFCWCVSDVNSFHREYRLNTPTFLWDYSHIVPLKQIEVTSETWTWIEYNLVVSGASGVLCKILTTLSMYYWSTNWKYPHSQNASENDFRGPSMQALPRPSCVSLSRAVLSFAH